MIYSITPIIHALDDALLASHRVSDYSEALRLAHVAGMRIGASLDIDPAIVEVGMKRWADKASHRGLALAMLSGVWDAVALRP